MSERPAVILALTPAAEREVEHLLFGPEARVEPRASIAEPDELEQEAQAVEAQAVLVSPDLTGLTPGHLARVRARGLRIIGLALDEHDRAALSALGVDETVDSHASAEALAARLAARCFADPDCDPPARPEEQRDGRPGSVVAVVGGKGSPGSSELAASLAALAGERWQAVLVELDLLGGSLDLRLGADGHRGSLVGLVRAAAGAGGALRELLERWLVTHDGWPPVLLAPPEPDQAAAELACPGAVGTALRALAGAFPLTVCDVGFLLGPEEGQPARAHREAVVSADAVLLCLGAREPQLRAGLRQLDLLITELAVPAERLRVVATGVGGPGAIRAPALLATLTERLAERGLVLDGALPWDARALARSVARGLPLAAARRRGPYARALRRLLDELFLPVRPEPRGRKRRLPVPPRQPTNAEEEVALPWRSS